MKRWGLWPLLLAFSLVSCVLSPGHDLPSAGSDDNGEEGPAPPPVTGGDGDIIAGGDGDITFPPDMADPSCSAGGGIGGMGGACSDTTAHR